MKLSRTIGYAIQAALQLAEVPVGTKRTCHEMAEAGHMPERFLLQILRGMVTHGVLRSTRGVNGGYTMTRSPDRVSLLEIIEAVEGPIGFDRPEAVNGHVAAYRTLTEVQQTIRHEMEAVKLTDLSASINAQDPEPNNGVAINADADRPPRQHTPHSNPFEKLSGVVGAGPTGSPDA